ncbi:HesA/MoeB/ThiF family protein [Sorangium sp. So ce291]|uniref:HesA/MoeB/ThiF family protein n=1 Tax=Sorangium sp. So ce291 TaxID=3133294 RepID=UPI003F61CB59
MSGGDGETVRGCVLLVGAGGIGGPAALALAAGGVRELRVADDDEVELTNLHRQILFDDDDVGRPKLEAFAESLRRRFPRLRVDRRFGRFTPSAAAALMPGVSVVVDATDNFASRFLIADVCRLTRTPVVHAAAVRWRATVMAVAAAGGPCYRCLFEDLPTGEAPDCATAGVAGPVCGVAGAIAADRALAILKGDASIFGRIATYDGLTDTLRSVPVAARSGCALCGDRAAISTIDASRYVNSCAAQGDSESGSPTHVEGDSESGSPTHVEGDRASGSPTHVEADRASGSPTHVEGDRASGSPTHVEADRASGSPTHVERSRESGSPIHLNTGEQDHG